MIYVGLDDTDTLDDPGTNQLARHLVRELSGQFGGRMIVRHQLLEDPRVPCTKKERLRIDTVRTDPMVHRWRIYLRSCERSLLVGAREEAIRVCALPKRCRQLWSIGDFVASASW